MSQRFEIWLRPNRRILLVGGVVPLLLLVLGFAVAFKVFVAAPVIVRVFSGALGAAGAVFLAVLVWYGKQPRLAYDGKHLLVYLRSTSPIAVPIEAVECFLFGSGLRELSRSGRTVQMSHLAVRLAERATDWADADVKPALGKWCGGYITIYGAWCEPLNIDLVHRLNARLALAHEEQKTVQPEAALS
jgi:hypothetical protein